ncbi:MAG: porin [Pseudomonadota bacterium]
MDKKLIALAVAGLFVAPMAMADNSSVVISGQIHMSVDSLDGKNAAGTGMDRQTNVSSNASYIDFSGKEDMGNGLNAIWKLKTYVSMGGTGNSGDPYNTTAADGFTNGPAYLGLAGNSWGAIKLGKDESPMKMLGRKVDLFGNQIGDSRNLSMGFDNRPNNAIEYNSAVWGGFSANVMYSTNLNGPTNAAKQQYGTANTYTLSNSVDLTSATAYYDAGAFFVGLGYEKIGTSNLGAGFVDTKDWRVAAGGNIGDFKLVGVYEKSSDQFGKSGADQKVWGVGGAYKMGSNTIKAQYYKAGDVGNTANSGAKMYAIGFDHSLSKRTTAYLAYARTNNDAAASYSAFGAGHGDNPGTVVGGNPSGFSVGMIHNF